MRIALVNPPWTFEGNARVVCREPHLPLELGYAKALLEDAGHDVLLVDAQLGVAWDGAVRVEPDIRRELARFVPEVTAITTAPSYLFWRSAPAELRVPKAFVDAHRDLLGKIVVVGPHASTAPHRTRMELGADAAVLGECEDILLALAGGRDWRKIPSVVCDGVSPAERAPNATDLRVLVPLAWPAEVLARHRHHHHRFDRAPDGPGAEVEASRGCPYRCTFCAKQHFRDRYRFRPTETVIAEIDALVASGARYVYFIDEVFVPDHELLAALAERNIQFGVQLRIDSWRAEDLELLGRAGCVSIECNSVPARSSEPALAHA